MERRRDHRAGRQTALIREYDPGDFWDEMFAAPGRGAAALRAPWRASWPRSRPADVARRQRAADHSFQARGITFAVNQGAEGVEKIMPFDLVPAPDHARRVAPASSAAWSSASGRSTCSSTTSTTSSASSAAASSPPELVLGAARLPPRVPGRGRAARTSTPTSSAATWCATRAGEFYVLEDNLRTPSGVSYLVENRRVLKRVWPQIFRDYDVRPVEDYPQDLLEVLRAVAPPMVDEPTVVLLTPGRLQLGVLRARLPGQGDGRRAGAGLRPVRGRRPRSTCARRAAGSAST